MLGFERRADPHIRHASRQMRNYAIVIEYKHLAQHIPSSVFVLPSASSIRVWDGVIFIKHGIYRGGIFRFVLHIPDRRDAAAPASRLRASLTASRPGAPSNPRTAATLPSVRDQLCSSCPQYSTHWSQRCVGSAAAEQGPTPLARLARTAWWTWPPYSPRGSQPSTSSSTCSRPWTACSSPSRLFGGRPTHAQPPCAPPAPRHRALQPTVLHTRAPPHTRFEDKSRRKDFVEEVERCVALSQRCVYDNPPDSTLRFSKPIDQHDIVKQMVLGRVVVRPARGAACAGWG